VSQPALALEHELRRKAHAVRKLVHRRRGQPLELGAGIGPIGTASRRREPVAMTVDGEVAQRVLDPVAERLQRRLPIETLCIDLSHAENTKFL
jgi:hypothetical protein